MANMQRGESSFSHEGVTYRLVFDLNAFAEAEEAADMGLDDLLKAISPKMDAKGNITKMPRLKHMGAMLFGALQAHHSEFSRADAIRLMDVPACGEAIAKGLIAAMPKPVASAGGKAKPRAGTGTRPKKTGQPKD